MTEMDDIEDALERRLRDIELKKEERVIVGELLIDFFEVERNLNCMLTESILDPTQKNFLDTILDNTPLRHRIEAAKEYLLLTPAEAKLFHKLCDARNKLAHSSSKKRIADLFPPDERKLFIKRCADLNSAIRERRSELLLNWL